MIVVPETHSFGVISFENIPAELLEHRYIRADLGLMTAKDGRIWLCINGEAFIRFSPHIDGKMRKSNV